MKIIRLTTLLDFGGQERKYLSFTEQATLLRHDYHFAAIGYGGNAEKILKSRGFEVTVFNKDPHIRNLQNIYLLYKWIKAENPDVVHTAAAEANFHGVIAAKLAGVKKIYAEEIGLPNHSALTQKVFNLVYRFTEGVICVSKAVKDYLIELNEIKVSKGIVLYNPVSIPIQYDRSRTTTFEMVYVGRLEKVKNLTFLIKALSKLDHVPNIKLKLVGEGRERKYLEDLISKYQLQDHIELIGFSEVPEKFVSQADLFILPSLSEGFGIAVVEAMMQGVPCLCSRVGGIPEFIIDNHNGWLFHPEDEEEFLLKLKTIINMPASRLQEVGKKAKEYSLEHFPNELYVKKLEEIYER